MRYLHSRQVEFGGLESTLDRVDARILHRCHQPRTLLRRDGEVGAECGCVNNRRARACRVGCYGRSGACTGLQAAPVGTREPAGGGCSGAVEGWGCSGSPPGARAVARCAAGARDACACACTRRGAWKTRRAAASRHARRTRVAAGGVLRPASSSCFYPFHTSAPASAMVSCGLIRGKSSDTIMVEGGAEKEGSQAAPPAVESQEATPADKKRVADRRSPERTVCDGEHRRVRRGGQGGSWAEARGLDDVEAALPEMLDLSGRAELSTAAMHELIAAQPRTSILRLDGCVVLPACGCCVCSRAPKQRTGRACIARVLS